MRRGELSERLFGSGRSSLRLEIDRDLRRIILLDQVYLE
jgi:hypothetical protein